MKNKINLKSIFLIFLIIQPFADCYLLYSDRVIEFLGFSPTTIVRILFIAIYCVIIFFKTNRGKKEISIYLAFFILFFIIHHFSSISVNETMLYRTFKYSFIEEVFYFLRMFIPIGTIYIVHNLNYTEAELKKIIKFSALGVSTIIIILNVTGLALTSYGSNPIGGTIFDWLKPNIPSIDLASKGWFNSANQIGAVVIILTIMMNYYVLKEHKKEDILILISLILSAMMVGTRTSSVLVCYVIIFMFVCYIIIKLMRKELKLIENRFFICDIIIICFMFFVYGIAPIANCYGENFQCLVSFDGGLDSSKRIKYDKNLKYNGDTCNFLTKTPTNEVYYESIYPCEENIAFWDKYSREEKYKYANNRTMEVLVTKDVYRKIKTPFISLFGMGRSRFLSAELYLEKDIYVHYYTIGIIGIIILLLVPYLYPCLKAGIMMLKKKKIEPHLAVLCFAVALTFAASYMSGHILDELIATIYLAVIVATILNELYPFKAKKLTDRVLIVNDERMMGGVSILLEDIINNIDKNIKIDLLILHNHGTRLNNLPSNVNVIYGTKFFNPIDLNIKEVIKTKNIPLILNKIYLVFLIKTRLISLKIRLEREKILSHKYAKEIAFKEGFCGLFTAYGDSENKIQWLHSDYAKKDFSEKYRRQFISLYNRFNTIVAVSHAVADSFNNIYHQEDKTIVINNLIDTKKIKKLSTKTKIDYDTKLNFISVGRLHIDKGFDRVIKILAKLNQEELLKDFKYRIIGDGYEYDNLKALIDESKLNDKVELLGRKENPYPYILSSDMFVMSSVHESFGLVVVEALTLKVPVLSVKLATIGELLNLEQGMIVDNDDTCLYNGIKEILVNQKKINEWKNNLKEYQYNNSKIIKDIEKLLKI